MLSLAMHGTNMKSPTYMEPMVYHRVHKSPTQVPTVIWHFCKIQFSIILTPTPTISQVAKWLLSLKISNQYFLRISQIMSFMHATYSVHLIVIHLIILTVLNKEHKPQCY
jgi:hypothetical protein